MTGCRTVGLQPGFVKDGVLSSLTWLDDIRLEEVDIVTAKIETDGEKGGPQDIPVQHGSK